MTTRWHLNVPEGMDRDVRMLLARRGLKNGDLSQFIVNAVKRELVREAVQGVRLEFEGLSAEQAQALAHEAVERTRAHPA